MIHETEAPQSGKVFSLKGVEHPINGPVEKYYVEDWWDRLTGGSWMFAEGNPAALQYAMRSGLKGLPIDNEALYGHIESPGGLGMIIHVSELREEIKTFS